MPDSAGLPQQPTARLWEKRLLMMVHDTPMLAMAPPLEQRLPLPSQPPNVLLTT